MQIFALKEFLVLWQSTLEFLSFCMTRHLHDGQESCHVDWKYISFQGILISKQFMYFLRSCPLARAKSLAALFTSLSVVCEWPKAVIFNHFSFKTSAIISSSWGKVNFVIQTKNLRGESSKSARKTAKVKQNRRLVMSLH